MHDYGASRAHAGVAVTSTAVAWLALPLGVCLAVLNSFFFINLFGRTSFIRSRRYPFYWLIPVLLLNIGLGFFLLVLAFAARNLG
jgi:hypothetical protein